MLAPAVASRFALWRWSQWVPVCVIMGMVALSPNAFRYDEGVFAGNMPLIDELGPGAAFIRSLQYQSPGPLYQYVHWILKPVTNLNPVAMRAANLLLFFLAAFLLQHSLSRETVAPRDAAFAVRPAIPTMLRSPTTWVLAGLALSEMPAILFLSASLVMLREVACRPQGRVPDFSMAAIAGLLLGIAVLGRTQFIVVIAAAGILVLKRGMRVAAPTFCISAAIIPSAVFWIWGGLVPPHVQSLQSGFTPFFGLLAVGYLAAITLFMYPSWCVLARREYYVVALATGVLLLLNCWLGIRGPVPLRTVVQSAFPEAYVRFLALATPAVLAGASVIYLLSLAKRVASSADLIWTSFLCLALLLIAAACIKSSAQFSSRYVAQAIPMLMLLSNGIPANHKLELFVGLAGSLLGAMSLGAYYLTP